MGRANVQVVSTRAGLHSLAHRYGRTISVFTRISSSDRIILNQYSIRGDALWYELPPLSRTDALARRIHSPESIRKILGCLGLPCVRRQSRRSAIEFQNLPSHSCRQDESETL